MLVISLYSLLNIAAGDNQENDTNGQKSKTGSRETNHSWEASVVRVPDESILAFSAVIIVNNTTPASNFALNTANILFLIVSSSCQTISYWKISDCRPANHCWGSSSIIGSSAGFEWLEASITLGITSIIVPWWAVECDGGLDDEEC